MRPELTLIRKSGPNPVMSKRIFLDEQGEVCSDGSQCAGHRNTRCGRNGSRSRQARHGVRY
jgi:hypothetical protein